MAISISNFDGQKESVSGAYPDGDIKDNDGITAGTKMNRKSFADIFQFFAKLMRMTGTTPNNLPDNETNNFQFDDALSKRTTPFFGRICGTISQSGSSNPTCYFIEDYFLIHGTWDRISEGIYRIYINELDFNLSPEKNIGLIGTSYLTVGGTLVGYANCNIGYDSFLGNNYFEIKTFNLSNSLTDGLLENLYFEVKRLISDI